MSSLIDAIRKRFLETIRSVNPHGKWKILVVDEHSQKLLGAVLKTYDVLEENVTLIEAINSNRSPQPQFEALYLIMATTQNIERVVADFANGRQQYAAAHLFFLDALSDELFQRLTSSPAEPHLKQLVDLYLNFSAIEAQAFTLNSPDMFFSLFSPPRDAARVTTRLQRLEEDLRFTSKAILNMCVTLNENPLIRYYKPSHHGPLGPLVDAPERSLPVAAPRAVESSSSRWARARGEGGGATPALPQGDHVSKKLAFMIQEELDEYRKANPDFPKPGTNRPRGVLIITDRSMDTAAPFLHEFTYQAMANDLLRIENGKTYHYKFQSSIGAYEDKTAVLTDTDTIWTQVRHMHMREAIDKLMADFNKFLEENAGFKGGEGAASLNDMKDMLANLPQYQEMREKFSLHLTMAQECMELFEKKKLPSTANVEQNCATGVTPEGKTPKTLVEEMVPLLDDKAVSNRDKVRIIALYIMHRDGVPEEDQRRLFQHARLSLAEQDAIKALVKLGVRATRVSGDKDTRKKLKFKNTGAEEEYELSRYRPLIQDVLSEHISGKLDMSIFPYVRDAPTSFSTTLSARAAPAAAGPAAPTSLRSAKPSWHRAPRSGGNVSGSGLGVTEAIQQRVICFVAGGMTYSEMRAAYVVGRAASKDVYIGSTHVVTPERFVDDLKVLEMEGIGSHALPNGIPNTTNHSFQAAYDKRYFTPDAPPPPRPAAAPQQQQHPLNGARVSAGTLHIPHLGPSPTPSSSSSKLTKDGKEKKEKKRGLFHF